MGLPASSLMIVEKKFYVNSMNKFVIYTNNLKTYMSSTEV